jgi:UDP-N-acetylglucosamine--N-acetylmuramyl-(pentapeptide) pyrophosphoryl-undecaprenol N-acetylglucosamine transferase
MRILFSPSGLGLGHVGRCVPIARRLEKEGAEILFSTYMEGARYAKQEGFSTVEGPSIKITVKPDGTVDFEHSLVDPGVHSTSLTILKQVNAEIEIMKAFKPDVVVSDTRVSSLIAAELLGIPKVSILNQFQVIIPRTRRYLRLAKLVDAGALAIIGKVWTLGVQVLIPDFPQPLTLSAGNLRIPNAYRKNVRFIGSILSTRPNELPSQRSLRRKLGLQEDKTVIFGSISGPIKQRSYFSGILRRIFKEFPANYQVVMSLGYPNASTEPIQNGNLTVYKWLPNRFEYLKACDLVIARAGHETLMQSICYCKPAVLVPIPSHTEQFNNAKKASELGVASVIAQENLNKQKLLEAVREMLIAREFKQRVEQIQREALKMDGVKTAAQIIREAVTG